jgi:ABC-2 type transport system ATP-binding protein
MLAQLKEQGITILVSTPYMDEASLCDRVAFMQEGSLLAVDTPLGITGLFRNQLFAVRSKDRHRLIIELRASEHAISAYAFGNSVHYTDRRSTLEPAELLTWLAGRGLQGVEVERITPGIEDTFMALMEERRESTNG